MTIRNLHNSYTTYLFSYRGCIVGLMVMTLMMSVNFMLNQSNRAKLISSWNQILQQHQRAVGLQPLPKQPKTHLGLLKVHKAASTTTQAIFLRFGWRKNLTFVLPPEYNRFGYPNIISLNESVTKYNTLPAPNNRSFSILCHHVVYGKDEWRLVLPEDSAVVGTVREPYSLFKSICNYFHPRSIRNIRSNDQVGTFLQDPTRYEKKGSVRRSWLNNRLAFEYGVHPDIIENRDFDAFDRYLHDVLDNEFDVVMLADRYDESLVLMKRKLNWDLNDIVYAVKNVRSKKKPDNFQHLDEHKPLHRNYSIFDYLLYEFFAERLEKQIQAEGPSFTEELEYFRSTRKRIENFCHNEPESVTYVLIEKTEWNEIFVITRADCEVLHRGEITFTQDIRRHQYGSATWQFQFIKKRKPKPRARAKH